MAPEEITRRRLTNQRIAAAKYPRPLAVAEHMGAMQGQDYYGTLWALGLRTSSTGKEVIRAFEDAEIVRTWPQRGTRTEWARILVIQPVIRARFAWALGFRVRAAAAPCTNPCTLRCKH